MRDEVAMETQAGRQGEGRREARDEDDVTVEYREHSSLRGLELALEVDWAKTLDQ